LNLLTNRWFEVNPKAINHPIQIQLKQDLQNKKFQNIVVAAGRRSFKTERFAKRYLIRECMQNTDRHYYAGAPTLSQSREIFWDDLKKLSPKWAVKKINETGLKIEFITGSVLRVVGLKEFKRIQGQLMHGIVITEYQECDPNVYNESIEPMINDTYGWCIKEGRPLGKNHFYDDYLKGLNGQSNWGSYHWTAEDILDEVQITNAKSNLSEQDYKREYLASFDTESGNPYYPYNQLNNRKHIFNNDLPAIVTCDFNATDNPMSWVVGQKYNENGLDFTAWMKSLSYQFTNTETMCGILDDHFLTYKVYPKEIKFYGDYAGKQEKSNSSYTDWQIIENYFRNKAKISTHLKPCKSIRDSIGATNAQLCNALGIRKQFIDPLECQSLLKDWEYCIWKSNSKELDNKDPLRGHSCRAVDYYNDYEYPIKGKPTIYTNI